MIVPSIQEEIFRAYDIRGIVGEGLNAEIMYWLGKAIGSEALYKGEKNLYLGSDARLSSPEFSEHMRAGILDTGCNVVDLGQIPTPLLYFATHTSAITSGVMIIVSHNPKNYNGLKVVFKKKSLSDAQITIFKDRIFSQVFYQGKGSYLTLDIKSSYIEKICSDFSLSQKLKVIIDSGNAITASVAPTLFEKLGCDVVPLYCEIDGSFPNHHPDPTNF